MMRLASTGPIPSSDSKSLLVARLIMIGPFFRTGTLAVPENPEAVG